MQYLIVLSFVVSALLTGCAVTPTPDAATVATQVADIERAFARTMADRDLAAFESFLSDETVFLSGSSTLRGKQAVIEAWSRYYEGEVAPFSWRPETVEVLDSGRLALSTGPVHAPDGTRVATYTSIWRREQAGVWRIVFDRGTAFCDGS